MASGGRPGGVLLGLGLLAGCHWSPPPGQFPGAMLTVRLQGPLAGRAEVRVDGARAVSLRSVDVNEVVRYIVRTRSYALETRGIIVSERGRFRVMERSVLRYYARTIDHLLTAAGRKH